MIKRGLAVDIGEVGPDRGPVRARKGPTTAQKRRAELRQEAHRLMPGN